MQSHALKLWMLSALVSTGAFADGQTQTVPLNEPASAIRQIEFR